MRALILLAIVATPAVAADQFDLVCKTGHGEVRYRIDLARGEYCAGECKRVLPIKSVTSGELLLEDRKPSHARDVTSQIRVNRSTGEWHTFFALPGAGLPVSNDGLCERAEFSGFPAAKF